MLSIGFGPAGSSRSLHVTFDRTGQSGVVGSSLWGLIYLQLVEELWVGASVGILAFLTGDETAGLGKVWATFSSGGSV